MKLTVFFGLFYDDKFGVWAMNSYKHIEMNTFHIIAHFDTAFQEMWTWLQF